MELIHLLLLELVVPYGIPGISRNHINDYLGEPPCVPEHTMVRGLASIEQNTLTALKSSVRLNSRWLPWAWNQLDISFEYTPRLLQVPKSFSPLYGLPRLPIGRCCFCA